jgi:hypothetical protein
MTVIGVEIENYGGNIYVNLFFLCFVDIVGSIIASILSTSYNVDDGQFFLSNSDSRHDDLIV